MLDNRRLIVAPIHHVMCYLRLDRRSNAEIFVVEPYAKELFGLYRMNAYLRYDEPVPRKGLPWTIDDPEKVADFRRRAHDEFLPGRRALRSIESVHDYIKGYFRRGQSFWLGLSEPAYDALMWTARGELGKAADILRDFEETDWAPSYQRLFNEAEAGLGDALVKHGDDLSTAWRANLAEVLHRWEYANVQKLGVEKYWEKTPFPLEER